jgi:membrane associated rhomboid family serine protease
MLPIGDDNIRGRGAAIVTYGLIALNLLAFLVELNQPTPAALQSFITSWGVVPTEYSRGQDLPPYIPLPFWTTLLTSMFLHGGWAHIFGNMLYLWIFGDNLEHTMGRARFLVFYLATGLAAGLAHIVVNGESGIPSVGASGAISGVLGGYLMLFPRNRVRVLVGYYGVTAVPAYLMLGIWILLQFVSGIGEVARTEQTGGVAYMAHIGGFVAGLLLVKLFAAGRPRSRRRAAFA